MPRGKKTAGPSASAVEEQIKSFMESLTNDLPLEVYRDVLVGLKGDVEARLDAAQADLRRAGKS